MTASTTPADLSSPLGLPFALIGGIMLEELSACYKLSEQLMWRAYPVTDVCPNSSHDLLGRGPIGRL
jgi:hypothetical protein